MPVPQRGSGVRSVQGNRYARQIIRTSSKTSTDEAVARNSDERTRATTIPSDRKDARAGLALLSGTIAYFLMFAIVPAMTAFVLLYSVALTPQALKALLTSFVSGLPLSEAQLLQGLLNNILASTGSQRYLGGLVALLLALWGVLGGAGALVQSIGLYTAAPAVGLVRRYWRSFVVALHLFVAVSATAAAITLMAGVGSFFPALAQIGAMIVVVTAWLLLLVVLGWLFSSIYRAAGVRARAWGGVSKGGIAAAILFVGATALFGIYIANFGSYNATYGALAGIIVLLLWLRLAAVTILWGSGLDARDGGVE
ncbi:YihY/virulence factor BrkB family protein [Stakelama marina]|uniref:YihY/virulence factor BrkB family protein n=1 Tax=Stakelama marina TaxID=2826939 RepID=A0A8T4I9K5_9SPHN|nr:YihY/virulence factor BrkB family protein [Stakelama marina]MBR0551190.1 YihY/virulence factor BrkB family protein [Stakelama marina]